MSKVPTEASQFYDPHVFICQNQRPADHPRGCCRDKGSQEMHAFMKSRAKELGIPHTRINQSDVFQQISMRYTEAGLRTTRLRPDDLFLPVNQRSFLSVMEQSGAPFDYLLFVTITSGTTQAAGETQKDYQLNFELIEIATGKHEKESASLRKGYYKKHGLR